MKKKKIFITTVISVLALLLIAASIQIMSINESNGFIIHNLVDGSSIIVNQTDGYQFEVNKNWYPILSPATEEDIARFEIIATENNVPSKRALQTLPTGEKAKFMPLVLLDLDSNHYENDNDSAAMIAQFKYADFILEETLNQIKSNKDFTSVEQIEKNKQIVYIVNGHHESTLGKIAILTRNHKLIIFGVATGNSKVFDELLLFFDKTMDSLEFFDVQ